MPIRRALALLTVLAAGCTSAPQPEQIAEPVPSLTAPPTSAASPSDTDGPEPSLERGEQTPVSGRIVTHGGTASIRTGSRAITLDTGELPSQPTWSRDGSRVVVMSREGPLPLIDVFDGTNGEPIGGGFAERPYYFFSWSHDGTRIAALGPGPAGTTLDILDADGGIVHPDVASAGSLFVAWDPDQTRLVAHADESLLRVDADGTVTELGLVGRDFFAPKWIPGSSEILLVVDIEGTSSLVRRGVETGDPMTTLGPVEVETGIAVNPDGRFAAIAMSFDGDSDAGARVTGVGPRSRLPGQTLVPQSGRVEIVDLVSGERVVVHEGFTLWTEWSPDGSRLLISTLEGSTTTWWIHEAAPLDGAPEVYAVTSFTAGTTFFEAYLAFADQFIEQPRLWSPAGDAFVYAEETPDGSFVRIASAAENGESTVIGHGEVGFWSPSP